MSSKKESSQKFFTVQFTEDDQSIAKTTKIPAKKGKTLKEAVDHLFINHNFTYDKHSVFLESSQTPLPFTSDCFMYGGCTLNIKGNDEANIDERVVNIIKDEERKSPVSYLERTKRYSDLLVHFLSQGFNEDETDGEEDSFTKQSFLEPSWKEIVNGHEELESKQRVQQDSIWEILTTEKTYIEDLRVITTVFKKCFCRSKDEGFLKEVDTSLIFANIDEIYAVNVEFYELLLNVVQNSRRTRKPMEPSDLVHAFDRFEILFRPYIKYCNQDTTNIVLPDYSDQTNKDVKNFFLWCNEHPRCKRIKLQGFLIKPLQRVTKYSLLLRAVERKTEDESDKLMLDNMMSRVETFVSKINSAVHMRQEQEKLLSVVAKFETYTPVDPVNDEAEKLMNEYCKLDLKNSIPGFPASRKRFILKEGPMKLIEKQMKKEIQAFLFTDIFILARLKKNTDKYKIIRQPFRLNRIVVKVLKDPGSFLFIYLNDFDVLANAFVLQISVNEQALWLKVIDKAQKEYENAIEEEANKKGKENDESSDTTIIVDTPQNKRMRNRFSKRNSTIRAPIVSELITRDIDLDDDNDINNNHVRNKIKIDGIPKKISLPLPSELIRNSPIVQRRTTMASNRNRKAPCVWNAPPPSSAKLAEIISPHGKTKVKARRKSL